MDLKLQSPKPGSLSPSDCNSDPEEKEISDDDDDDRNHKHRRRETRSQSLERDGLDQVLTRPYRKHNKHFPNGQYFRGNESQGSASWKNYNTAKVENDFPEKFDKRRLGSGSIHRVPFDANQRSRTNQIFFADPGPGRGRGSWVQRDYRFSSDIASQMVHQGPVPPSVFAGRGLPNVSNAQTASWNAFGLIPGMPNGGLDALHSIGLQGTLRPPIHSSLNMGITRPRCRDFEERGFCLRGDMCPMEHGVNRIVVDDVQSLSQFNLPVSLPSAHLLGTNTRPGSLAPGTASSTTSMNSKGPHSKSSKHSTGGDNLGSYLASGSGGDLYDPDQPLWNDTCPETSNALLTLHSPKIDETEALLNVDPSDNEFPIRSAGNAVGSQNTVWGRIGNSKSISDSKEKIDPAANSTDFPGNETIVEKEALQKAHVSHPGKRIVAEDTASKPMDSSSKAQFDTMCNNRKPSQKAMRTLFVHGIPNKSNKREALLAHFQKFGNIIDIYIPVNSERAFVQFSTRQEAEAALKSPDAVMGNRFIKLWWANRDSIPDENISSSSNLSVTPLGETFASMLPHTSVASSSKDNLQVTAPKSCTVHNQDDSLSASDNTKFVISNGLKFPPPLQKKLCSLEQLKEDLRKKQELLEQKRNDFRRKLDQLAKQTTGQKAESDTEQAAKRPKVEIAVNTDLPSTPTSSNAVSVMGSPHAEMIDKAKASAVSDSPKTNRTVVLQEVKCSKQLPVRPFAPLGAPFIMNRYKLDNRPTVFRVLPPLPAGFSNVAVLKEHFSQFGDLSNVEIEDEKVHENGSEAEPKKDCLARITFTTRPSAERAFLSGKCWEGNNLKFAWLTLGNSINHRNGKQNSSSTSQAALGTDVQPGEKLTGDAYKEDASSGNKEPENGERQIDIEGAELGEGTHPAPSQTCGKNESPEDDVS